MPGRYESVGAFAVWTFLKAALAALAIFLIVRIVIPDLINAHRTLYVWAAVACGLMVPILVGWAGLSIWRSVERFRRRDLVISKRSGA